MGGGELPKLEGRAWGRGDAFGTFVLGGCMVLFVWRALQELVIPVKESQGEGL